MSAVAQALAELQNSGRLAPRARSGAADSRVGILDAAAECFPELGFSATSIDVVARRLGATKGMIYHHFPSKTDLFFEVYRRGMAINFAAIEPYAASGDAALIRLTKMAFAHAVVLMQRQTYQRVLAQGVALHQQGSTTAAQRETLDELIDVRNSYEALFRSAIAAAAKEEGVKISDLSLASKSFLAVLNSTVYWYHPRAKNPDGEQAVLARELVAYAMRGLGCDMPEAIQLETKIGRTKAEKGAQ